MEEEEYQKCEECGSDDLSIRWAKSRMLYVFCRECHHHGDPYVPEVEPIETSQRYWSHNGGWMYYMYDQYGHTATISQNFSTQADAHKAAMEQLERYKDAEGYGKCTAVIWPPFVMVEAQEVLTLGND